MNRDLSKPEAALTQSKAEIIDTELSSRWRNYVLQVSVATGYLAIGLLVIDHLGNLAVISAMAASAFLAFCLPQMPMAQPKRMLGGHLVALLVTMVLSPVSHDVIHSAVAIDLLAALSVGLTMFGMAVTNTEHPPAAGTALGLSLQPWEADAALSVIAMVLLLIAVFALMRGRLVSLL